MEALQMDARPLKFVTAKFFASFMGRKSYWSGPGRTIRLVDIPEPELPGEDWVKIKTIYCGFCGSDLNLIMLHDSPGAEPFTSFPAVPGHEFIGEIVAVGTAVNGFASGDMVAVNPTFGCEARGIAPLCNECSSGRVSNCRNQAEGRFSPGMFLGITKDLNGGFAPYTVAHKSQLFKIPESLSKESAVMTEPVSVALQTVFENRPKEGEKVLVIGAGVIGNLIIQSIRALGIDCGISVMDPSGFAGELALDAGADTILRPKTIYQKVAELTGAKVYKPVIGKPVPKGGFDRVYDTVGNSATLNTGLRLLGTFGVLSLVGIGTGLSIDPTTLWLKLQTIKGVYGYGVIDEDPEKRHTFEISMDLMMQGKIKAEALITHKFQLKDYLQMMEVNANKGKYKAVKTIVTFE